MRPEGLVSRHWALYSTCAFTAHPQNLFSNIQFSTAHALYLVAFPVFEVVSSTGCISFKISLQGDYTGSRDQS